MRTYLWKHMLILVAVSCCLATPVFAHFQVLIPTTDIVTAEGTRAVDLTIAFTHPMEQGPLMNMDMPTQFGVMVMGEKKDLKGSLTVKEIDGQNTYTSAYRFKQPGDHVFFLEPAPYWEPAEEVMIIHYTKVIVNSMSQEEGWDTMVGFPVEIDPLTRPYGLWTGNVFRGVVKKHGQPVPFAEIEVEYYNENQQVAIPADPFITQVIKADANGMFSYVMPRSGWWAFAALLEGDEKMNNPEGDEVDVELGALLWIKTVDMK